MGQKFFISFNSADQTKAHWVGWILREAGHEVAVHDWEIPAGGNAPLWMNNKLAWADRLIAVISPDYMPNGIHPWNGHRKSGTTRRHERFGYSGDCETNVQNTAAVGRPSRIDLTNCSEAEASTSAHQGRGYASAAGAKTGI